MKAPTTTLIGPKRLWIIIVNIIIIIIVVVVVVAVVIITVVIPFFLPSSIIFRSLHCQHFSISSYPHTPYSACPQPCKKFINFSVEISRTKQQRGTKTAATTPGPAACGEALQCKAEGITLATAWRRQPGPCSVWHEALQRVAVQRWPAPTL